jgi:hypothetical protein
MEPDGIGWNYRLSISHYKFLIEFHSHQSEVQGKDGVRLCFLGGDYEVPKLS